jgi:DNA repair protein RecO (recombination protein O)
MIESATGLILRTYPLTESSLIVHWLTSAFGRLATVAKGARKPKSLFRGKLDLFYLADFSFARSRRSELHTLREISVRDAHSGLRRDIAALQQVSYCSAFVEQVTETDTPLPEIFELLRCVLRKLSLGSGEPFAILAFELKMLALLGLQPDPERTSLTAGSKKILSATRQADWESLDHLCLSAAQLEELRRFLHGYLIYHLGRLPKGREAALLSVAAPV